MQDIEYMLSVAANPPAAPPSEQLSYIHQIFIQRDGELPRSFPESLSLNTHYIRSLYPRAAYRLYSGNDIRTFIRENFDGRVLRAYDQIIPFAYKCDLARLCVLFVYGGLYVDLGVRVLFPLGLTPDVKTLFFRCPLHRENNSWDVENSIMYAVPGRREFEVAIDLICANVERRFYGVNSLAPTGPGVIGRALAIVGAEDDYAMGFSSVSNTPLKVNFFNYILPSGNFVATRSKDGRLNVVVKGANDYNVYWQLRIMYGEQLVYLGKDFISKTSEQNRVAGRLPVGHRGSDDGVIAGFTHGSEGCVVWGPYKYLPAGRYKVTLFFAPGTKIDGLRVDFFDVGIGVLHEEDLFFADEVAANELCIEFTNPYECRLMEVRLHSDGRASGGLISVAFEDLPVDHPVIFKAGSFSPKTSNGGASVGVGHIPIPAMTEGLVVWGPHKPLSKGRYRVTLEFTNSTDLRGLKVDFHDIGLGVLYEECLDTAEKIDDCRVIVDFGNPFDLQLLEVRIHSLGVSSGGAFTSVAFQALPSTADIIIRGASFERQMRGNSLAQVGNLNIIPPEGPNDCSAISSQRYLPEGTYQVRLVLLEGFAGGSFKVSFLDHGLGLLHEELVTQCIQAEAGEYVFDFPNGYDLRFFQIMLELDEAYLARLDHVSLRLKPKFPLSR